MLIKLVLCILFSSLSFTQKKESLTCRNYEFEEALRKYPQKNLNISSSRSSKTFTIPILFHEIFRSQNISEKAVFSADKYLDIIESLNTFFGEKINFCLATHFENQEGKITPLDTPGRKDHRSFTDNHIDSLRKRYRQNFITSPDLFDEEIIKETVVDSNHILNIWIGGSFSLSKDHMPRGYAFFPSFDESDLDYALPGLSPLDPFLYYDEVFHKIVGKKNRDGVFVSANTLYEVSPLYFEKLNAFRKSQNAFPYQKRVLENFQRHSELKTLVHEIGHYLSLFHTFGTDATCKDGKHGDFISETPNQNIPVWYQCNQEQNGEIKIAFPNVSPVCPGVNTNKFLPYGPDLVLANNAMSYADHICKRKNLFTPLQLQRMHHTLEFATNRKNLGRDNLGKNPFCQDIESLSKISLQNSLTLFPNPLKRGNSLFIKINDDVFLQKISTRMNVMIIDSFGRIRKKYNIIPRHLLNLEIKTNLFEPGVYFLEIREKKDLHFSRKFLVQ